jgi:hypothetical protein
MKNLILKISVAILTFVFGLTSAWFLFVEKRDEANSIPQTEQIRNETESKIDFKDEFPDESKFENLPQNPYELEKIINENSRYFPVDKLWKKFGIEPEMKLLDNPFFGEEGEPVFFYLCHSCKAEIFEVNLDKDKENEVLLGIGEAHGYGNYRFLAFKKLENNWKFVGYADHDINKYYSPEVRVETFNDKKFLVLTCLGGWGTGISISFERWFELENNQLNEILSFPNKSHSYLDTVDLGRESKVFVKNHISKSGKSYFEVKFTNNFSGYSDACKSSSKVQDGQDIPLFQSKKTGYYVLRQGSYHLDEEISQITNREIVKAYIPLGLDQKEFKNLYPNEINKILREGKSCRAKWLKYWFSWER